MSEDLSNLLNFPGEEVLMGKEFMFIQKYLNEYKNEMLVASGSTDFRRNEKIDFIGAQPISMRINHVQKNIRENLQDEYNYFVCEKTDGVRYVMVVTNLGGCYLTGRNTSTNSESPYRLWQVDAQMSDQLFEDEESEEEECNIIEIFDGELILDHKNGKYFLKFLVFDCIVHFGDKIFNRTYYERLTNALYFVQYNNMCFEIRGEEPPKCKPLDLAYTKAFLAAHEGKETTNSLEDMNDRLELSVIVKDFFKYKHTEYLFENYIPTLPHHNDGLIFTKNSAQYKPGTDQNIIKWKPPQMNTIDFLLIANTDSILDELDCDEIASRVIDLYVMEPIKERKSYEISFFDFMIVDTPFFDEVLSKTQQNEGSLGIVAECKWIDLPTDKIELLKKIYSADTDTILKFPEQKKDTDQEGTRKWISSLRIKYKKTAFAKGWGFERYRLDKNFSNNINTAKDIVSSIEENLDKTKLGLLLQGLQLPQNQQAQSNINMDPQPQKKLKPN